MKFPRRKFLRLAAGAAALPAVSQIARAQAYPSRPVRIVVGFAAGGTADILARLLGQRLSERLGHPFIVENRPGAATSLAIDFVAKAPPDGHTLLLFSSAAFINPWLYEKLNFNFINDIAAVASIANSPNVMVVNPSLPAKTVPEFIAYAKANPGKITMASSGTGSVGHIVGELFKTMAGVDMVHVPYRGDAPALTDLIGGQVHVFFSTLAPASEYIRTGKVRALGVTTAARWAPLPEIPTVGEFVQGYEASLWNGLGASKGTPAEIVEKLNKEINAALDNTEIKTRLSTLGVAGHASSPTDFGKLVAYETEKWGKVIRAASIKAE